MNRFTLKSGKGGILLALLVFLFTISCSKQGAGVDVINTKESYRDASSALYYSIKVSTAPRLGDLGPLFSKEAKKFYGTLNEPKNEYTVLFLDYLNSPKSNVRGGTSAKDKLLEVGKLAESIKQISEEVKKSLGDFIDKVDSFRKESKGSVNTEIEQLSNAFNAEVINDNSLSLKDKEILFNVTNGLSSQSSNIDEISKKLAQNGRCWFCGILNVIATIIVVAIAVAVIAVAGALIAGAAIGAAALMGCRYRRRFGSRYGWIQH